MQTLKEVELKFDQLLLDPNNPRFAKHSDELVAEDDYEEMQSETFSKMIQRENNFEIAELAKNISKNGYLGFDRMFVKKLKGSKFLVIEGNRRLAAIYFLLKQEESHRTRGALAPEIKKTFLKIPCVDLTNWETEDIKRLLGLRHYDSVKDWRPLPGSFNLFLTYMAEYAKVNNIEILNSDHAKHFIYDQNISRKIADIYAMKEARVKSMILTYRVYLQVLEYHNDINFETTNLFSIIEETISKEILRKRFEFDPSAGQFSENGLELFIDLCIGKDGSAPVITEVSRGESTLRDYAYVLQEGSDYDRERIELNKEKSGDVKADVKSSQNQRNLINTLKQIKLELGKINLDQIKIDDITDREKEIIDDLQETLNKLKGASGGKL
ncbi:MAG: hypothetical protein Q7S04_00555 [Candidatus Moranbacteria bacterium]|nr:hypothetical protein [Candidatus Moranbacteria bacterium]